MMSSANDAGSSQKEILFMRGNAISGAPIMSGTNQLPKPPISAGISTKKIMVRPCALTITSSASWKKSADRVAAAPFVSKLKRRHRSLRPQSRTQGTLSRCPCGSSNRRSVANRSADHGRCARGQLHPSAAYKCRSEYVGVALAGLGKGNDLVGDGLLDVVGAVARAQSDASHLEGHAHGARSLRVEVLAVKERL